MPLENGFRKQTPEDSRKIHLFGESSQLRGNGRGWLPRPGRSENFNIPALRGQGSVLRVQVGCQCTLMDWLRISRLLLSPFEALWILSSQGTYWAKVVSVETRCT